MERGDIADFDRPEQACIFEGLLASKQPLKRRLFAPKEDEPVKDLKGWVANELPLKSFIDSTTRLGQYTWVFTLMGEDMAEPIYQWLLRKGVSATVTGYASIDDLIDDLKYNRGIHTVLVTDQEHAARIGIRSKVVSASQAWGN